MRERWKQVGLTFLSLLLVAAAFFGYAKAIVWLENSSLLLGYVGLALVCLVAYLVAQRWIERRVPTELSPRHAVGAFLLGLAGGIALFSLVMAFLWIAGDYRIDGWNGFDWLGIAMALLFWICVAVEEEILYRALLFRLCSKVVGTWGALIVSAAIFGGMHITNPGWTVPGLISVAVAGVMLAAAYTATGRLWLPIGIHTGWNFTQGSVFGLEVSGNDMGAGLIAGSLNGPSLLTGGRFGPEATIEAVVIVTATAAYLLWRTVKLRRTEPPIWAGTRDVAPVTAPA